MSQFTASLVGEFFGTTLLILLGNGVVANVLLTRTKGQNAGLMAITWGWAMAVFVGVFTSAKFSGAHLNPAVTIGLALSGSKDFDPSLVLFYIVMQMLGAMFGATLVWLHYFPHWSLTEDKDLKLAVFCTGPAVRNVPLNIVSEVIGTFVLVFAALYLSSPSIAGPEGKPGGLGAIDALPIGLVVLAIGLSLGGTTGYAINPARDLGPRIMHFLLPIPGGKRDCDWSYSWIPVFGPVIGAIIAALAYRALGGQYIPPP